MGGHISEDVDNRINMVEKRMRKLDRLKEEVEEPWVIGKERPENLILCWGGSTYGAVREVVYRLDEEGGIHRRIGIWRYMAFPY